MKFRAPVVPHLEHGVTDQATREIGRAVSDVGRQQILQSRLTETITLVASGSTQTVEHKLGRTPRGITIVMVSGAFPAFTLDSLDAKRITITSAASTGARFKLQVH